MANFLRLIKVNLKKDAVNARRERSAAAASAKDLIESARRPHVRTLVVSSPLSAC